ncbi:hypothetical protein CONPUDRAFT_72027 [Coniophora puteana RWD-64-598 SS2]|uniref:Uncharacterized protein n=1 Tax=Coniophora puteana (strain RWD-64-598) TaxID=741705 RepID=A0A5M3MXI3_CONPW|nr:uncharacterized protein CONPUDRAFT_72027 [Coniophora puteana RWD-64-598 SS2]EIW83484.1 hypothetical protein CONPUDRAFT_72027 [Coniophora puteana RWD-64-598 SS2]
MPADITASEATSVLCQVARFLKHRSAKERLDKGEQILRDGLIEFNSPPAVSNDEVRSALEYTYEEYFLHNYIPFTAVKAQAWLDRVETWRSDVGRASNNAIFEEGRRRHAAARAKKTSAYESGTKTSKNPSAPAMSSFIDEQEMTTMHYRNGASVTIEKESSDLRCERKDDSEKLLTKQALVPQQGDAAGGGRGRAIHENVDKFDAHREDLDMHHTRSWPAIGKTFIGINTEGSTARTRDPTTSDNGDEGDPLKDIANVFEEAAVEIAQRQGVSIIF